MFSPAVADREIARARPASLKHPDRARHAFDKPALRRTNIWEAQGKHSPLCGPCLTPSVHTYHREAIETHRGSFALSSHTSTPLIEANKEESKPHAHPSHHLGDVSRGTNGPEKLSLPTRSRRTAPRCTLPGTQPCHRRQRRSPTTTAGKARTCTLLRWLRPLLFGGTR